MATENALFTSLVEKIDNDTLVLPTLPAIALKVRKAAEDPEVDAAGIADVLAQDPSLSARIIKLANSAWLNRATKVQSLRQAVVRIGSIQTKNIATALAMEQLFVTKHPVVKQYLQQVWERTVKVVTYTLALHGHYRSTPGNGALDSDVMLLAALVHDIGTLPILTEAERHGNTLANTRFLDQAIYKLSGHIGGAITAKWGFDSELVQVAESWRDLKVHPATASYIDFVRLGAIAAGLFAAQRDSIIRLSLQKHIIDDPDILESELFLSRVEAAKSVFG